MRPEQATENDGLRYRFSARATLFRSGGSAGMDVFSLFRLVHELGQNVRAIEDYKIILRALGLSLALFPFLRLLLLPFFSLLFFLTLLERLWSAAGHKLLLMMNSMRDSLRRLPQNPYVPQRRRDKGDRAR
jgi:hypothetical protein